MIIHLLIKLENSNLFFIFTFGKLVPVRKTFSYLFHLHTANPFSIFRLISLIFLLIISSC